MICLLSLCLGTCLAPGSLLDQHGSHAAATPLRFAAGDDLARVLDVYAAYSGQLVAHAARDELRRHRLTEALVLEPVDAGVGVERLCRAAGLALRAEVHGPWSVLRPTRLDTLRLADATHVEASRLAEFAARPALPISTVLDVLTLESAVSARTFVAPAGVHVLRPGGGEVGWNGLVLWGAAADVVAAARAFEGAADGAPALEVAVLETVEVRPTFGLEDERYCALRSDEELSRLFVFGARGRFTATGAPASLEELLRAYELVTWRPVEYMGGAAQRARRLPAPPLPRARLTQEELDHWVQAALAMYDLVGQPDARAGMFVRPVERHMPNLNPPLPEEAVATPTVARTLRLEDPLEVGSDLVKTLDTHGISADASAGHLAFHGPAFRVENVSKVAEQLLARNVRGPALLTVRVLGDASAQASKVLTRLHPRRNVAELCTLPWFGEPLVGSEGDEILVLAHPERVRLIVDEIRALDRE